VVFLITWFMVYDYPFGIFKLALSCFFFHKSCNERHHNGQKKQDKASLKIPKG
jgi:hypothetical protein